VIIELIPINIGHKETLRNLFELYTYDFSEYMNVDVDDHGRYIYDYIDRYFHQPNYHSFFVSVSGKLAGFVIVKAESQNHYSIDQFFIMKKYRKAGIGKKVAFTVFDRFPGEWRVAQLAKNRPAQAFWRKVISEYTNGNFQETFLHDSTWHGPVQVFVNSENARYPRPLTTIHIQRR
jgi:predicted acetyltransferase